MAAAEGDQSAGGHDDMTFYLPSGSSSWFPVARGTTREQVCPLAPAQAEKWVLLYTGVTR
jgi:hypothetical protein